MSDALHDRYLKLLGVPPRPPTRAALAALVRAHLQRVPFENVSKLWRLRTRGLRGVPELEDFLDGIEHLRLGGTCFSNALHLHGLLRALGYRVRLHGADMSRPDVHVVNVVELDGRELLVDVGYGAPLLDPVPLDAPDDVHVDAVPERFVLRPRDPGGGSVLELHRDGARRHGYRVTPAPRAPAHFGAVIAESFHPAAWFMNRITFIRFWPGRALILRNLALQEARGGAVTRRAVADRASLPAAIEAELGVPRAVTAEALAAVPELLPEPT